jgi:hypothetical protein
VLPEHAMAGRARAVDAVGELAQLSLVSKVCTELENNCGINDPTLGTSLPTAVKELTVTQRAHLQSRACPLHLLAHTPWRLISSPHCSLLLTTW